jgi:hypothetical protein
VLEKLVRDDELAWSALGAGRMLRAPTVFEDIVKTVCTSIRRRRICGADRLEGTESR